MTQVRRGLVTSDHIAWCKAERANAASMIALLTTYGARFQIHEFAGALRDITAQAVDQKRRIVRHLDAFLISCEPGEDVIEPVTVGQRPVLVGRPLKLSSCADLETFAVGAIGASDETPFGVAKITEPRAEI
jgi:hypothetical protein